MKKLIATLGTLAIALSAGVAGAKTIPITKLPRATMKPAQTAQTAPTTIPASSKVEGLYVSAVTAGSYYSFVRSTKEAPSAYEPKDKDAPTYCFADPNGGSWVPDELRLYSYSPVASVRAQRLIPVGKKGAKLLILDAWVDVNTGGSKLIEEHEVKLAHMGTASTGVKVFAARDTKEELVHFLVRRAPTPEKLDATQITSSVFGFQQILTFQNQSFSQSACDWMTVDMKRNRGRGTTATVRSEVALRAEPRKELVRGVRLLEVRVRPMYAHLSLTKSSRDKNPVASVSFGWAGRGSTQQIRMTENPSSSSRDTRRFEFEGGDE